VPFGEQAAQRHPLFRWTVVVLQRQQLEFDRPQGVAGLLGQVVEGLTLPVERADVPGLDDLAVVLVLLQPSQRQALGPADVGAIGVDPTSAGIIQKGAGPRRVGGAFGQQLGVGLTDPIGLDRQHRQLVLATIGATRSAQKPGPVEGGQGRDLGVDLLVQDEEAGPGPGTVGWRVHPGGQDTQRLAAVPQAEEVGLAKLSGSDRWVTVMLATVMFTSGVDMLVMTPILPQLAKELGVNVSVAGLWITAYAGSTALFALIFGPISDHWGRRRVLVLGLLVLALGTLCCAWAEDHPLMLGARVLAGAGAGMLVTSTTSFAGDHFGKNERAVAIGHVMNGFFLSLILGMPIGAWLSATFGWQRMFLVLAGVAGLGALGVAFTIPEPRHEQRSPQLSLGHALGSYRSLLADRRVVGVLLMSAAIGLSMTMYSVYTSPWLELVYGLDTGHRGLVYAVGGPAIFVGGPVAGRLSDRFGRVRVIVIGSVVMGVLQLVMPACGLLSNTIEAHLPAGLVTFGSRAWPVALPPLFAFFVAMAAGAARSGPYQTLAIEVTAPEQRGAQAAMRNACNQAGTSFGAALGGILWASAGYSAVCVVAAAVTVLGAVALLVFLRIPTPSGSTWP
jgi:predicted MFS family arabinose efflux permease